MAKIDIQVQLTLKCCVFSNILGYMLLSRGCLFDTRSTQISMRVLCCIGLRILFIYTSSLHTTAV